jgi:hypothetical protein
MCENIKKLQVNVDELALSQPKKAVDFIHGQYRKALDQVRKLSLS